jgi:hypothetical protein
MFRRLLAAFRTRTTAPAPASDPAALHDAITAYARW